MSSRIQLSLPPKYKRIFSNRSVWDASKEHEAKEIAERILRFRKERGITQVELSQQLGIT